MSVQAISWVLDHSEATLGARLVLISIANHADKYGRDARASVTTYADGMEYEFTILGELSIDHVLTITKSRLETLQDQQIRKPDAKFAAAILHELESGQEPVSGSDGQAASVEPGTSSEPEGQEAVSSTSGSDTQTAAADDGAASEPVSDPGAAADGNGAGEPQREDPAPVVQHTTAHKLIVSKVNKKLRVCSVPECVGWSGSPEEAADFAKQAASA